MRLGKKSHIMILVLAVLSLSVFSMFFQVPVAQSSPVVTAYKVVGTTDLGNPGSESFWSSIPWTNISLTANIPNAPTSGLTKYLLVKAAWNGSDLIFLLNWEAPKPAYNAWSAAAAGIYPPASGPGLFRLVELTPGVVYKVVDNSTFSSYVSIVNGKEEPGRIIFNYSGILLPAPNDTQIHVLSNGTIILFHSLRPMEKLLYGDGMFYGYYVNSTWYYPDRAAIMWYLGSGAPSTMTMVGMHIGGKYAGQVFDGFNFTYAGGSLKLPGGSANIWMWVSGATWNSSEDPAFKVNLWQNESDTGLSYTDLHNHGFAVPLFTNNTNMYEVDTSGIWYAPVKSSGLNDSLFYIWTGAKYSNGSWTVEYVYPLNVPSSYEPFFAHPSEGNIYYIAFAIWQGPLGESLFDKSIVPNWLTFEMVDHGYVPPTTTSLVSHIVIPTAVVTVTVVGVIVAILAIVIIAAVYRR
ncbi:cytochrome b558/566 subunit A [Candidatus Acidianus copahuensis]|uniref:Cytochrome b558/566 subunit A n=1 Tax=Candidatus Acidianus copahuensis TaxID=1160895 RepID=A0A031LKF3_9CREN|nr:cytochrome b558/566 subunit A [Candidatus Acidianus copahuensis]EZQ02036.1 cytochrome b558/566 subunit A [Candidatus Acidianus copahuensis]